MCKFIKGFFLGALVGSAAALLYAPKKGSELREELKNDLSDKTEDLKAVALDYVELASVKSKELSKLANEKSKEVTEKLQEHSKQLKEYVHTLKSSKQGDNSTTTEELV